jgi:TatD DNase family protein
MSRKRPLLVDSHCHLDFPEFAEDRDAFVARAREAGVGYFLTISTWLEKAKTILAIADSYEDVAASVGTHPHNAAAEKHYTVADIVKLSAAPKAIGLGECGLDYHYNKSPAEDQQTVFRAHIRASLETGLPLIIHTREAEEDTMRILREEAAGQKVKGLLHCFSSSRALAEQGLDFGLLVSFSGIVTFKSADDIRETARMVPLDRMLVETDAPFLAPVPMRGKPNEPAFVKLTAEALAELKGISFEALAEQTTSNFFQLFTKAQRPQ